MTLLKYAPGFDLEEAANFARDFYDVVGRAKQLPSERDQNFLLIGDSGDNFVLKIANSCEQRSLLEAQNQALRHLQEKVTFCPRVIPAKSGEEIVQIFADATSHYVRLVTYIPGELLAEVPHSSRLLFNFGERLGTLTRSLADFDHPSFHRDFHWDLANGLKVITEYGRLLPKDLRGQLDRCTSQFEPAVVPLAAKLPRTVIHGDANDYNVLVEGEKVVGLIDFGDMMYSYTVSELAVAIAYVVLDKSDPLLCAKEMVAGYSSESLLNEDEIEALWWLILLRLCMSLCLAAYQQKQNPENVYLDISQRSIRKSMPALLAINPREATDMFRQVKLHAA